MLIINKPQFQLATGYSDMNLLPTRISNESKYSFRVAENIILEPFSELSKKLTLNTSGEQIPYDSDRYYNLNEINEILNVKNCQITPVPTGVTVEMPENLCLALTIYPSCACSGLLTLINGTSIIDTQYFTKKDQIYFYVLNLSPYNIYLKQGDIIGQGIFLPIQTTLGDEIAVSINHAQEIPV